MIHRLLEQKGFDDFSARMAPILTRRSEMYALFNEYICYISMFDGYKEFWYWIEYNDEDDTACFVVSRRPGHTARAPLINTCINTRKLGKRDIAYIKLVGEFPPKEEL